MTFTMLPPPGSDHRVLAHPNDDVLAAWVGDLLAPALRRGERCVVLATEERRRRIADELRLRGLEPAGLRRDGQFKEADASDVADRFARAGRIDPHRLAVLADSLGLVGAGSTTWAYGEVVAELWALGLPELALELEDLWNQALQHSGLHLLCSYPSATLAGDGGGPFGMDDIAVRHSDVEVDGAVWHGGVMPGALAG